jgi:pantothenate kinase-related protein Tda10
VKADSRRNKVFSFEDLTQPPGRFYRPPKLVIIMRGLPGSGKTHMARAIKTTETEQGFEAPRILSLDDYFECDGNVRLKQKAYKLPKKLGLNIQKISSNWNSMDSVFSWV